MVGSTIVRCPFPTCSILVDHYSKCPPLFGACGSLIVTRSIQTRNLLCISGGRRLPASLALHSNQDSVLLQQQTRRHQLLDKFSPNMFFASGSNRLIAIVLKREDYFRRQGIPLLIEWLQ